MNRQGEPDAYFIVNDLSPNVAVMSLDQLFDNGKADACPPCSRERDFSPR